MKQQQTSHDIWQRVNPLEIVYLRAESNYTFVYLQNGQKLLVALCLKELEKRLETIQDTAYLRIHKSSLVNFQFITQVNWRVEEPFITLANHLQIVIARRKRAKVRKQIKSLSNHF